MRLDLDAILAWFCDFIPLQRSNFGTFFSTMLPVAPLDGRRDAQQKPFPVLAHSRYPGSAKERNSSERSTRTTPEKLDPFVQTVCRPRVWFSSCSSGSSTYAWSLYRVFAIASFQLALVNWSCRRQDFCNETSWSVPVMPLPGPAVADSSPPPLHFSYASSLSFLPHSSSASTSLAPTPWSPYVLDSVCFSLL